MKYKSELIKEIMDTRGHESPLLHYESECIEKWIKETKGAYPKLCDYESEWLNYMTHNEIGKFPYVTVSANPTASVNNVVPYAYKSAILKGCTLVNVKGEETNEFKFDGKHYNDYLLNNIKDNTKYLILYDLTATDTIKIGILQRTTGTEVSWASSTDGYISEKKGKLILNTTTNTAALRIISTENNSHVVNNLTIVEYQDGMENWDIPFFNGMQSVKMPVLTTSNEDGTKTNILSCNEEVELRGIGEVQDTLDCLTGQVTQRIGEIVLDGSEEWEKNNIDINSFYFHHNESLSFGKIITDNYPIINSFEDKTNGIFKGRGAFGIIKNDIENEEQLKQWLSQNPITVQYQLATESIKTVDLSIVNQDGNVLIKIKPIEGTMYLKTNGEILKPTFTGEVPVEAITQNLASFNKLEMEE